jgi:hypothetical protein
VRRISNYFDCCPDQLTLEQQELYFAQLVESTARYAHLTDTAKQNAFATINRLINTLQVNLRRI